MKFLIILLILIVIGLVIFVFNTLRVISKNNFNQILIYFRRYLWVVFLFLFITHFILIIMTLLALNNHSLIYILLIKVIIEVLYFILIFINTRKLLKNLNNEIIFDESNSKYTKEIGISFVYLALTEITVGLVMGVINFINEQEFKLITNSVVTLYLIIGIILVIVSVILDKAIEIYKENSLTI